MTDRYALLLLAATVALAAAGVAALVAATGRRRGGASARSTAQWPRIARGACYLSLALLLLALLDHIYLGHAPGSSQALSPFGFVREHEAFLVIGALAGGLLWWVRPRRAA